MRLSKLVYFATAFKEARPAGETLNTFAYYLDPAGVRIEIVDRALFPDWPGFLEAIKRSD